jgi:hypothetical protein
VCPWEWGVKTKHSKVLQALKHAGEGIGVPDPCGSSVMIRVCLWEWGVKTKHSKVLQASKHAGEGIGVPDP